MIHPQHNGLVAALEQIEHVKLNGTRWRFTRDKDEPLHRLFMGKGYYSGGHDRTVDDGFVMLHPKARAHLVFVWRTPEYTDITLKRDSPPITVL